MIVGVGDDVAMVLLILGDGIWAYLRPFLMDLRWPFTAASEQGFYFWTCSDVILGNVAMYPVSITLASVWSVGKNREAW